MLFEKENLDTDTMTGELILGILATIAQEESISLSQNQACAELYQKAQRSWRPINT